jgi:hypothetical protein
LGSSYLFSDKSDLHANHNEENNSALRRRLLGDLLLIKVFAASATLSQLCLGVAEATNDLGLL